MRFVESGGDTPRLPAGSVLHLFFSSLLMDNLNGNWDQPLGSTAKFDRCGPGVILYSRPAGGERRRRPISRLPENIMNIGAPKEKHGNKC